MTRDDLHRVVHPCCLEVCDGNWWPTSRYRSSSDVFVAMFKSYAICQCFYVPRKSCCSIAVESRQVVEVLLAF